MFVAAGLKYVLLTAVLFVPSTILYFWARREQNARLFTPVELIIFVVTLVAGAIGLYGLVAYANPVKARKDLRPPQLAASSFSGCIISKTQFLEAV